MSQPGGGPAAGRFALRPSKLTTAEIAWIALLPCAAIAVLAIVFLGPPVGDLLFTRSSDELWPRAWWVSTGHAEPSKHGRFVVAVLAPLPLVAAILASARRTPALSARVTWTLVHASYALLVALIAVALVEQELTWTAEDERFQDPVPPIFGLWRVLAAAAVVLIALALLRRDVRPQWIARLERATRRTDWIALAAAGFIAIWVMKAVTTDRLALGAVSLNLPWTLNDVIAVLDGRTPLVDYHPIYAKLLPYLCVPVLSIFGTSALAYTIFMALLSGLCLLAVYGVFRRITRRPLIAVALLIPFIATSDVPVPIGEGIDAGLENSPMMLPALWPMRYGGAYLLAWLTARHIDGCRPRHAWVLFFVSTLVAIDSLEFGAAAAAAVVAALLCARPPSSVRDVMRLAAHLAGGAAAAFAVVTAITLARSGSAPDFGLLLEWPQIFSTLGLYSMPLRTWGVHLGIYATYVAAIGVAAVRLARRDEDALLTGMLAWSGVFGLLAGAYLIGRPDAQKITGVLSAWSFALSMLAIVCVRSLAAHRWRATLPQLLTLFGFALSVSSIATISLPHQEIARLRGTGPAPDYPAVAKQFIGEKTQRGEKVVVLVPMSYAITHDLGLRNVAPYGFINAIVTRAQMERVIATLRRERVRTVFIPAVGSGLLFEGDSAWDHPRLFQAIGYSERSSAAGIVELRSG